MRSAIPAHAIIGTVAVASLGSAAAAIDAASVLLGTDAGEVIPASPPVDPEPVAAVRPFGAADTWRLDVEADWIADFADADMGQFRVGVAWFFVEDFEMALYATGAFVDQPGTDAGMFGADLEFRWHFLKGDWWSLFASAGCGLAGATSSVPAGGTNFNFTPSAGGGFTFDVTPDVRAYVSARWFHVSNAGTSTRNPGRDNLSLWVGLSFPL